MERILTLKEVMVMNWTEEYKSWYIEITTEEGFEYYLNVEEPLDNEYIWKRISGLGYSLNAEEPGEIQDILKDLFLQVKEGNKFKMLLKRGA